MRLVLLIVTVVSTLGFNFHVILPLLARRHSSGPGGVRPPLRVLRRGALARRARVGVARRASWKALVVGTGGFSLALLALAPLDERAGLRRLLFVTGVCFTLWTSNANTILQLRAPDHLRGRVLSLYLWAFAGLAPVGGLLAGWLYGRRRHAARVPVAGATGLVMTFAAAGELRKRRNLAAAAAAA